MGGSRFVAGGSSDWQDRLRARPVYPGLLAASIVARHSQQQLVPEHPHPCGPLHVCDTHTDRQSLILGLRMHARPYYNPRRAREHEIWARWAAGLLVLGMVAVLPLELGLDSPAVPPKAFPVNRLGERSSSVCEN